MCDGSFARLKPSAGSLALFFVPFIEASFFPADPTSVRIPVPILSGANASRLVFVVIARVKIDPVMKVVKASYGSTDMLVRFAARWISIENSLPSKMAAILFGSRRLARRTTTVFCGNFSP